MFRHVYDTQSCPFPSGPHSDQPSQSTVTRREDPFCLGVWLGFFFLYFTLQDYPKAPQFDSIHPYVFLMEKINKLELDYHHYTDFAVKPHIYRL